MAMDVRKGMGGQGGNNGWGGGGGGGSTHVAVFLDVPNLLVIERGRPQLDISHQEPAVRQPKSHLHRLKAGSFQRVSDGCRKAGTPNSNRRCLRLRPFACGMESGLIGVQKTPTRTCGAESGEDPLENALHKAEGHPSTAPPPSLRLPRDRHART